VQLITLHTRYKHEWIISYIRKTSTQY